MSEVRWKLAVERNACITSGLCAVHAPAFFKVGTGGSHAINDEIEADDQVIEAAESCPMEAIRVTLVTDGTIVAPLE